MSKHSEVSKNESAMTEAEQALYRATSRNSLTNYPAIFSGFTAKGISESEIIPRVNVLTYKAWQAKGRQVRKGESGVKVTTFVEKTKTVKNEEDGTEEERRFKTPNFTTVFHITQTDPI